MASNASSGQVCNMPGKASEFPNFDDRTSLPTKGGEGLTPPKGATGVLGLGDSGDRYVKSGGNAAGGRGGSPC